MKKPLVIVLLLLACSLTSNVVKANYAAGGDLIYIHISDSTYQVFLKLYRNCAGSAAPDSVQLCLADSCNKNTLSYKMPKWTGSTGSWAPPCPNTQTTCDNINATYPGFEELWYSKVVTLTSRCNAWRIFTYLPGRAASTNISNPSSQSLYLEAWLNNSTTNNNSSAYYSVKPMPYCGQNISFTYNPGPIDADGDSLFSEIIYPMTGVSSCSGTPTNATLNSASPAYNASTNPFQTGSTFFMNGVHAAMAFTPTVSGNNSLAIRTSEYRKGVFMGSVTREMQFCVFPSVAPPKYGYKIDSMSSNAYRDGDTIFACQGKNLSFSIDLFSSNSSSEIYAQAPGVSPFSTGITFSKQYTDTVHGSFNFAINNTMSGRYTLFIITSDTVCNIISGVQTKTQVLYINVLQPAKTIADTTICSGFPLTLKTLGDTSFSWTILPGGSMNSLSCTNCQNPIATPTTPTTYVVSSSGLCNFGVKDTVNVNIHSASVTHPAVTNSVSPGAMVPYGTTLTFTANATGCSKPIYQWIVNGIPRASATSATWVVVTPNIKSGDSVWCRISCGDTCASPADTISNKIGVFFLGSTSNVVSGDGVKLYPNPNTGQFTLEMKSNITEGLTEIDIVNITGKVVYRKQVMTNKYNIDIRDKPEGMYILRIKTSSGTRQVKFVVRN